MPTPRELTGREALRALLPPQLEYVRPGGGTLRTADEVIDQYEREWAVMSNSRVEVRELFESDNGIIAEVTIGATINGCSRSVEAAPAHRWVAGRLIRNRLYADPLPAEVWAVQPPAGTSR